MGIPVNPHVGTASIPFQTSIDEYTMELQAFECQTSMIDDWVANNVIINTSCLIITIFVES